MAVTKPVLVVIAGPNGSGKTALTKSLQRNYPHWTKDLVEVNPDVIAEKEFDGWNDIDSILKAAECAEQIREECLKEHRGFLFETVLSIPDKVHFIRRAKKTGFFIRLVYVSTNNPKLNALRIAWRVEQGGHTVPKCKIYARYERSLKLALEAASIVDRAYFVDNSRDLTEEELLVEPLTIFRMAHGAIAKTYLPEKDFPDWIKPIYEQAKKLEGN